MGDGWERSDHLKCLEASWDVTIIVVSCLTIVLFMKLVFDCAVKVVGPFFFKKDTPSDEPTRTAPPEESVHVKFNFDSIEAERKECESFSTHEQAIRAYRGPEATSWV